MIERIGFDCAKDIANYIMEAYAYSRFRYHRIFCDVESKEIHKESFLGEDVSDVSFYPVFSECGGVALVKLGLIRWDSLHFNYPMYRISCIHCNYSGDAKGDFGLLLGGMLESLDCAHIVADVDQEDYLWLNALIDSGFRIYDSKRSYVFRKRQVPSSLRSVFRCREFLPEDSASVMDILGKTTFPSRFSRDPFFRGKEEVRAMYGAWVENLASRKNPDDPVLVVERSGRIVAFGAGEKINIPPDCSDKVLCGNSIFFCEKDAVGSYPSLVQYLTSNTKNFFDGLELVVSTANHPAVRVLERLGLRVASGCHSLSVQV